jgi:FMN phosphatase YigB (HAD superfamily)
VRLRKPDPEIYYLSCRCIESEPETCAYVGDNPVRDVEGALDAGFGAMILYENAGTADREGKAPTKLPDRVIYTIGDLLDLFPGVPAKE